MRDQVRHGTTSKVGVCLWLMFWSSVSVWASDGNLVSKEWALENTGGEVCSRAGKCQKGKVGADIQAYDAWQVSQDCSGVVVAVLDSGVDAKHPDLESNIMGGKNFVSGADENDFQDDNLHGTHVAGTIAADGEVLGICKKAKVLAVKVGDDRGRLADSDILEGYVYAVKKGAKVINASFGGPIRSASLGRAIQSSPETLLIAAAGNEGSNNTTRPVYPANYGYKNIVVVAATDNRDELGKFSNYSATKVDLAAPGVGIISTTPMQETAFMKKVGIAADHAVLDGTSMAAPHVTGAVALYWSNHKDLTAEEVKSDLLDSVDVLPSLKRKVRTGGRLNLARLMNHDI